MGAFSRGAQFTRFLQVQDQKPDGTPGDAPNDGAYEAVALNTVVANTIVGASVAANQVTLPPGVYSFRAQAKVIGRLGLFNVTAGAYISKGIAGGDRTVAAPGFVPDVSGVFVLLVPSVIELRARALDASAATANNFGEPEVYAELFFTQQ